MEKQNQWMRDRHFFHVQCSKRNLIWKGILSFLTAAFLCFWPSVVYAQTAADTLQENQRVLRVGYYEAKGFQEGQGDESPKSGYSYEYLQKIAAYTGWKYQYVYGSWSELYQKLSAGKIDLMAGIAYQDDRTEIVNYPDYEMLSETFYIYKDSDDDSMKSGQYDSYTGKKIGTVESDAKMNELLEEWAAEHRVKITRVSYPTITDCARDFNEKHIDAFVSAENIVSSYNGITPVEKLGREPYYLCVSKQDPEVLAELNMALSVMEEQDALYLDELRSRYATESSVSVFLSAQEREWMDAHDKVIVGYLDHYLPYCDTAEDGTVTGLLSDLVPDLFSALPGHYAPTIEYRAYKNQKEMQESLQSGETDLIFPVSGEAWYAEQSTYQQSSNVVASPIDLVYREPYTSKTTARIAVSTGNQLQQNYTFLNFPDAELVYCDSSEACVEAVKNGNAGSTVVSAFRVHYLAGAEKQLSIFPLAKTEGRCLGVAFGNAALLRLLNHGLSILGDNYGLNHAYQYSAQLQVYTLADFMEDHAVAFSIGMGVLLLGIVLFFMYRENRQMKLAAKEAQQKRQLEEALAAAEEAGRARIVFLRNMSHDIRTPMNAIIGFANLALKETNNWTRVREYLTKILVSGNHLLAIVNDVLEISRIESGKTQLNETPCSLTEITQETEVIIREQALEKKQNFTIDLSQMQNDWVVCDKLRIREILVNLLGNAVKFTPEKGDISLTIIQHSETGAEKEQYEFHVKDNGCGMSKEFLAHAFEPFAREQNSAVSKIQGTGLGLPISKHFVDLMGGTFTIHSEEEKGTEMIISLSLHPAKQPDVAADAAEPDVSPKPVHFEGMRILLVEDNELNREIATEILNDSGFATEAAKNGKEAVDRIAAAGAGYFDAVLMDLQMPVMDGYEAAREIRGMENPALAGIPIIALSANAFEEDKKASLAAGMNAHIAKPIHISELMQILALYLQKDSKKDE